MEGSRVSSSGGKKRKEKVAREKDGRSPTLPKLRPSAKNEIDQPNSDTIT